MRIHRITITLVEMPDPVWRTVEVPAEMTLADLYPVVQQAMGWDPQGHLQVFETPRGRFGDPDPELQIEDASRVTVDEVAPRFEHLYDFGDGWRHEIVITETFAAAPHACYPRLVNGAGVCPPGDSGGPIAYATMLDALADPSHEDHERYLEWTDGGHDPAAFDLASADRRLRAELAGVDEWLAEERIRKALRAKASGIVAITDEFCLGHLDTAFAGLCRAATAKLARKRPSPLARGDLRIWSAGIVYAMGSVNFPGDGSHPCTCPPTRSPSCWTSGRRRCSKKRPAFSTSWRSARSIRNSCTQATNPTLSSRWENCCSCSQNRNPNRCRSTNSSTRWSTASRTNS